MKKVIGGLIVCIFMQFIQPNKNEKEYNLQPFFEESNASKEIQNILFNACTDCHSNKTNYLWYSKITPVNFLIANHINEGKKYVNFSEWETYNENQKKRILNQCEKEIDKKKMPLKTYIIKHPDAKLSKEQTQKLLLWITQFKEKIK